jgi:hypothetical protein
MKKVLLWGIFLLGAALALSAQTAGAGRWGIHFQVYAEPHETDNPVYVNVLPLVYEHTLGGHVTVKAGAVCGLRIADGVSLGNLGLSLTLPVYPFGFDGGPEGFFIGPRIMASQNLHTGETVISTAADAGYAFTITGSLGMTLGAELGVSTFFLDGDTALRPHCGPAVYLYF